MDYEFEEIIPFCPTAEIYLPHAVKWDTETEYLLNETIYNSTLNPATSSKAIASKTPQATLEDCLGLKFNIFDRLFEIHERYKAKRKELGLEETIKHENKRKRKRKAKKKKN